MAKPPRLSLKHSSYASFILGAPASSDVKPIRSLTIRSEKNSLNGVQDIGYARCLHKTITPATWSMDQQCISDTSHSEESHRTKTGQRPATCFLPLMTGSDLIKLMILELLIKIFWTSLAVSVAILLTE